MVKKNIVLTVLLISGFQLYGMELPPGKPLELGELPVGPQIEIIRQGIEGSANLKDAMQFIATMALTSRQFASLVNHPLVISALAVKIKKSIKEATSLQNAWQMINNLTMKSAKFSNLLANNQIVIKAVQDALVAKIKELELDATKELLNFVQTVKIGNTVAPLVINALIAAGANIEASAAFKRTPLILAAYRNNLAMVNALIVAGANINAEDDTETTVLMWAAHQNNIDVVKRLIAAGADALAQDSGGQTALDHVYTESPDLKSILQEAMARQKAEG